MGRTPGQGEAKNVMMDQQAKEHQGSLVVLRSWERSLEKILPQGLRRNPLCQQLDFGLQTSKTGRK